MTKDILKTLDHTVFSDLQWCSYALPGIGEVCGTGRDDGIIAYLSEAVGPKVAKSLVAQCRNAPNPDGAHVSVICTGSSSFYHVVILKKREFTDHQIREFNPRPSMYHAYRKVYHTTQHAGHQETTCDQD